MAELTTTEHPLNVLAVGQDVSYFQNLNLKLSSDYGFKVESVQTVAEGFFSTEKSHYDAIILDLDHSGEDWLTRIRELHAKSPFLPVIALGNEESLPVGLQVISEGGDDYLVKGRINSGVLNRVIRYGIEKKRQDKKTYHAEQKYRLLLEKSTSAICGLNPQGAVLYLNPAAEKFFGASSTHTLGKAGRDVLPFQDWTAIETFLSSDASAVKTIETPILLHAQRSPSIFSISLVRLEGEIESLLFIDQKEGDPIGKLTSKDRQSELERIQSEYVSTVSHYLKTPLASMRLYLDYLINGYAGSVTDKQKEYLTVIDETTERLDNQVTRLLNLSKIRSRKFQMKMEPTDLAELLEQESRIFKAQANQKNLKMSLLAEKVPLIYCDRSRICEVIDNFISNAIKYTPSGGTVNFASRRTTAGVELIFEDSGIGIDPQHIDAIFDPFCDIPKTDIGGVEVESTGLGLSLAKRIVELHQGSIDVTSLKGRGSVFTVRLPLEKRKTDSRKQGL